MIFIWAFWLAAALVILSFGAVLLIGAPYMPTLKKTCQDALDLLDLKPGQTLYELGSGDGVMLRLAAQRGINVVGYELNPFLVVISWLRTRKYRSLVKIRWRNFWRADLAQADGVFVFLLDRFMADLDKKMMAKRQGKPVRLVSHAFEVPGRKAVKKSGALFLYAYH